MERSTRASRSGSSSTSPTRPASLQAVLDTLAPVAAARGGGLIAVFGSAGERDIDKRPMMGRIAGERAGSSSSPTRTPATRTARRSSSRSRPGPRTPAGGADRDLLLIADRPAAIAAAFERARPGDVVLLAGKGHETSIIGPGGPVAYDERRTAEAALAAMGFEAG